MELKPFGRPTDMPQESTVESVVRLGAEPRLVQLEDAADPSRRFELGEGTFRVGRDPEAEIMLDSKGTSRNHARIEVSGDSARVVDLGSSNGTYVNGRRLSSQAVLQDGDELKISTTVLTARIRKASKAAHPKTVLYQTEPVGSLRLLIPGEQPYEINLFAGEHYVGRRADCDIVVPQPDVSRRHARLLVQPEDVRVEDLGSGNGTLVNGRRINAPTKVPWGAVITVGKNRLELHGKNEGPFKAEKTQLHMAVLRSRGDADDEDIATHAIDLPHDEMPTRAATRPRVFARPPAPPPAPPPASRHSSTGLAPARRAGFWAGLSAGLAILAIFLCGTVIAVLHERGKTDPVAPTQKGPGHMMVDSDPEGAAVFVDDRPTNKSTPTEIELTGNTVHQVEVRREDYEPRRWSVNLAPGERSTLRFMLVHSPEPEAPDASTGEPEQDDLAKPSAVPKGHARATLTLESTPPTEVYVGGARAGATPLKAHPVPPGDLVVELKNPSLGIHKKLRLHLKPGQAFSTKVNLEKGKVKFDIRPWAELAIEGKELGRSPTTVELYEGGYEVTVTNMDLGIERIMHVDVEAGKTTTITEELK